MKTLKQRLWIVALFSALAAGCASNEEGPLPQTQPTPGHAFLTIVGDRNVFLAAGAHQQVTVKYHDDKGTPLAGSVRFHIDGTGKGAALSRNEGVTNQDGNVSLDVIGGTQGEAAFRVVADAQYATSVDWAVSVGAGTGPNVPLKLEGTYAVESQFDIVSGLPGTVGDVVHAIIDMTDGPNDPATWLIDLALTKINNSTITSAVGSLRPAIDAFANSMLKQYAPDIVTKMLDLGNAFGDVTKKFGMKSTLQIYKGSDGNLLGKHTVTGVFFNINGHRSDFTLAQLNMAPIVVDRVPISLVGNSEVDVGDHSLGVSYGKVIVFGLDNLVIPLIDPFASNLQELMSDYIDCYSIGGDIANYVGIGDRGLYEAACDTAIAFAASYVEGKISTIGSTASAFQIHGTARPYDANNDATVDQLVGGLWEGKLTFGPEASVLAKPAQKFVGNRMTTTP